MNDEESAKTVSVVRKHIPNYEDLLTYFSNIANCLAGFSADESQKSALLDPVVEELLRCLRSSHAVFSDDDLSKNVEKIVQNFAQNHVRKIWASLNGKFLGLGEGRASSFILQALLTKCNDFDCLIALGGELISEDSIKLRLMWSKSGTHVLKSLLEHMEQLYIQIADLHEKEKVANAVHGWCKTICAGIEGKEARALRKSSPIFVLMAMSKISRSFPGILNLLLECFFGNRSVRNQRIMLEQIISNTASCRFAESLLDADFDLTMKRMFSAKGSVDDMQNIRQMLRDYPLEKPIMHIFSRIVRLSPAEGAFSTSSMWGLTMEMYGEQMVKSGLYGIFFSLFERAISSFDDDAADEEDIANHKLFYRAYQEVSDLLQKAWRKANEKGENGAQFHSLTHYLLSGEERHNINLHLISLLLNFERVSAGREVPADVHGDLKVNFENRKRYFHGDDSEATKSSFLLHRDFIATPSDAIRKIAFLPEGSRILQALITVLRKQDAEHSDSLPASNSTENRQTKSSKKQKVSQKAKTLFPNLTRFLRRFNGHFAAIASNTYGSHFVESIMKLEGEIPELSWVSAELRSHAGLRELRSTPTGRLMIAKYDLESGLY